ncbi:MAG: hypothetical protein KatS3mg002_1238 [Candidatus Woesearchaeota archaeon]|nr:MAG: hypothetical protein KatS3mg002_1238 [Candidatus Woesearchaeota archaeon]
MFYFEVTPSQPSEFTLLEPINNTISNILNPNLTWQQPSEENFANYTIIIDKDSGFGSPDFYYYSYSLSQTYYVLDYALDGNEVYYWKVIAYDVFWQFKKTVQMFFTYITDTLAPTIIFNSPRE